MIRLRLKVEDISLVLQSYDRIKIYRSTTELGSYNEITDATTRLVLEEELVIYYYEDSDGMSSDWYKVSYFNSSNLDESPLSSALQGGAEEEKIGYTFGNYSAPPREWGKILTADDIRYTFMWGIDATAADIAETDFVDEQFDFFVREALSDFERHLNIDIRKKVYKTDPSDTLLQSAVWREGVDYTDEEDEYSFDPQQWANFGFLQLRHKPVRSVQRAIMYSQVKSEILDLLSPNWIRFDKTTGQVWIFPTESFGYGPFATSALPWKILGLRFPGGLEFDYTTGYKSSDFVPQDLRGVVGKWATIKCLQTVGDGLLAGFSSQSVSLDGLSESFSSTQSATSVSGDTKVQGYGRIDSMYNNRGGWHGKQVLSKNRRTGSMEPKRILDVLKHHCKDKRSFRITTERGNSIVITEDHSLFTLAMEEIKGGNIRVGTLLQCNDYIDKVKVVENTKVEWMYDLSVQDNENFVANNFIVHNSAYFGARIKSYQEEIKEWLKANKYKWGSIPISFVGA